MCNGYGGGGANQKFPFLHFRLSAGGQGGAVKKWKEIFGFATRESASASEALGIEWPRNRERTLQVQATTHAERAKSAAPRLEMGSRKG